MIINEEPPYDEPDTPPEQDDQQDAVRTLYELHYHGIDTTPTTNGQTPTETLAQVAGKLRAQRLQEAGYPDLHTFLQEPEPEYDWLIPGLLERSDRVIVTGQEGRGKSTLLRQIALQTAAGIHPFTLQPINPRRTLLIDLENSRRHIKRQYRPLYLSIKDQLLPGWLTPVSWPAGIDLHDPRTGDRQKLAQLVELTTPDLLIIGPSYKLAGGDPTSEETARAVTNQLDILREAYDMAVILEAHQPYPTGGGTRAERPYGASLWSRWPEFGLHLSDGGELRHWRGDRDEREWPPMLTRGGQWPWTVPANANEILWVRITDTLLDAGEKLSTRQLAAVLGTHQTSINRAIQTHQTEYHELIEKLGQLG